MKNVISFGGGKDSLALLYLLEPIWGDSVVVWCNAGAPYHETVEQMKRVRNMVPYFLEVKSDVQGFIRANGFPVDVVPSLSTRLASVGVAGSEQVKYCSTLECCASNLWMPTMHAVKALGATTVYRGQRTQDSIKSRVVNGQTIEGITYRFPLQDWTDQMVIDYLGDRLPAYYREGEQSSRDCWCCTGYLAHNAKRIQSLPTEQKRIVVSVLTDLRAATQAAASNLDACLTIED